MKLARRWARAAAGGLVALALALGCRGAPAVRAPGAAAPPGALRAITPASYPEAARARDVALVLGTEADDRSTVVPLAAAPAAVQVAVVAVAGEPPVATIVAVDLAPVPVLVPAPAPAPAPASAAPTLAAVVAAQTLGRDPGELHLAATGDQAAGELGSAAIAAGYLAALLGAAVDRDAIVIGAIAIDGGVDPAVGTGPAIEAAIAAGKRRIGVAAAAAEAREPALAARARERAVTIVPVADVEDALAVLTGATLPRPRPADEAALALAPATRDAVAVRYDQWHARLAAVWPRLLAAEASGRLPATLAAMAARAERASERAERARTAGDAVTAYALIVRAWIDATTVTASARLIDRAIAGDAAGARAIVDELGAAAVADQAPPVAAALAAIDAAVASAPVRPGRAAIDSLAPALTAAVRVLVRAAATDLRASDMLAFDAGASPDPAAAGEPPPDAAAAAGVSPVVGAPASAAGLPPATLAALLAQAELRARRHATAARIATGAIAPSIRLRYQAARALATDAAGAADATDAVSDATDDDRRAALGHLRAASRLAQLAIAHARQRR